MKIKSMSKEEVWKYILGNDEEKENIWESMKEDGWIDGEELCFQDEDVPDIEADQYRQKFWREYQCVLHDSFLYLLEADE